MAVLFSRLHTGITITILKFVVVIINGIVHTKRHVVFSCIPVKVFDFIYHIIYSPSCLVRYFYFVSKTKSQKTKS